MHNLGISAWPWTEVLSFSFMLLFFSPKAVAALILAPWAYVQFLFFSHFFWGDVEVPCCLGLLSPTGNRQAWLCPWPCPHFPRIP